MVARWPLFLLLFLNFLERAGGARGETCGARRSRWCRTRGLKLLDACVLLAPCKAGAGGNKAAENDVLFEAAQTVNAAAKRRID